SYCCMHCFFYLLWIRGGEYDHVWKHTHDGNVFERMMCGAHGAIGDPASNAYELHVSPVIAHIIFYLFIRSRGQKRSDGIDKWNFPRQRKPRSHTHHIGFRCTEIIKISRKVFDIVSDEIVHTGMCYTQDNYVFLSYTRDIVSI